MARSREVVGMLERVAACHESSAALLHARGQHAEARQAATYACRIRLSLDEPHVTRRMHTLSHALLAAGDDTVLYEQAVDGALALFEADFGNVQLTDGVSGALRPAAEQRFASSTAARSKRSVAMLSITLIEPSGRVRAVVSVHFWDPRQLTSRDQVLADWYGERVAVALARDAIAPVTHQQSLAALHDRAAASHLRSAERHERSAQRLDVHGWPARAAAKRQWAERERERGLRELSRADAARALARA